MISTKTKLNKSLEILKTETMKKIKKVLIALDYDQSAKQVAEQGFSMAKEMGAEVILLHVITDMVYYASTEYSPIVGFTGFMDQSLMQLDTKEGLEKATLQFLEKFKKHLGDENIQTVVKNGEFSKTILQTAKEMHADVIAIGSHSRKWLEDVIMGSVTQEVLHHTTIPLFIIPTRKKD